MSLQRNFPSNDLHKTSLSSQSMPVLPVEIVQLAIVSQIVDYASYRSPYTRQRFDRDTEEEIIEQSDYIVKPLHNYATVNRRQLAILRRVSRRYNQAASPLFFQTIIMTTHPDDLPDDHKKPIRAVASFSKGPYAQDVRQLVVGTKGYGFDQPYLWQNSYYHSVGKILPSLLKAFTKLECLVITGPEVTYTMNITSPVPPQTAKSIAYMIENVFIDIMPRAEQYSVHPNIESHVIATKQAPLLLESLVMDWQTCFVHPLNSVIRADVSRYNTIAQYYQVFLGFVAEAHNLVHLCIRFSRKRTLLLNELDISGLKSLQILQLGCVDVTRNHLGRLCCNSEQSLRAIDLQLLRLRTGDWEDIYAVLKPFPQLEYLLVEECSYV